ncbi:MAG: hypothetical protein LC792_18210, partial [Actinobacteria bacterium]|nr:hypothetical protein [Actinomycetota bacterium]
MTGRVAPVVALVVLATACSGGRSPGHAAASRALAAGKPCQVFTVKELRPLANIPADLPDDALKWIPQSAFVPFPELVGAEYCSL